MCQDAKTPHLRTYTILFRETEGRWDTHLEKTVKAHRIEFDPESDRVTLWRRAAASDITQRVAIHRWDDLLGIYEDADEQVPDTVPQEWESAPPVPDDVPFP